MSMLFRDINGLETPVAGLNGTSGELVPSVSYYQSGVFVITVPSEGVAHETVTFVEEMPDTDYVIQLSQLLSNAWFTFSITSQTKTGFVCDIRNLGTVSETKRAVRWQAFKLMTDESRALDEQAIADIQAVIPTNATSSNKLVPASEFAETSGSAALASGLSGQITWKKVGRLVQVRINNVLKSSGAIASGATLCTGLPAPASVTSFAIARYPNEANVIDLVSAGTLKQTGMYSVASGIGLFGDFMYISAS